MKDTYTTIEKPTSASLFKEKGSKFYGYAFPISKEEQVKISLAVLHKKHPSAGHFCYAWQLGTVQPIFKVNDDGEPNNSAGPPIHGQIRAFGLTNVLLVSVRYFGGTKLGVGGLKQAYKCSAQLTLEGATLVEKTIDVCYQITFDHALMNPVMRLIKEKKIKVLSQEIALHCVYTIAIRLKDKEDVLNRFDRLYKIQIEEVFKK